MVDFKFTLKPVKEKPGERQRRERAPTTDSKNDFGQVKVQRKLGAGKISREELGSWLWGAADILRGAVSADEYGEFILPLLFYKRLSDVYLDEYEDKLEQFGDEEIARDTMFHRAVIPEGCLWEDVRSIDIMPNYREKERELKNYIALEPNFQFKAKLS